MKKTIITRWFWGIIILLILMFFIGLTRYFTEQNGTVSNTESRGGAAFIENLVALEFPVNHDDTFWKVTVNLLLRKAAHFTEYMLVGIFLSILLNILTRKVWLSFLISGFVCFVLAYLDELRQEFIAGRTPAWFDVKVDTYGALLGIILTSIFFISYFKIKKLKSEIKTLEEKLTA
jgi:VanZ family protein